MPKPLRTLCIIFVATLLVSCLQNLYDALTYSTADADALRLVVASNLVAAAISTLFIYVVFAFSKRTSWSLRWLQTLTGVSAVLTAYFLLADANDPGEFRLADALSTALSVIEMLTCAALWFVLRKASTKLWFANKS